MDDISVSEQTFDQKPFYHVNNHRKLQGSTNLELTPQTILIIVAAAIAFGVLIIIGVVAARVLLKRRHQQSIKEKAIAKAEQVEQTRISVHKQPPNNKPDALHSPRVSVNQVEDSSDFEPNNTPIQTHSEHDMSLGYTKAPLSARDTMERKYTAFQTQSHVADRERNKTQLQRREIDQERQALEKKHSPLDLDNSLLQRADEIKSRI